MKTRLQRTERSVLRDTRGATMAEYAIMLVLMLVVLAAGFRVFGQSVTGGASQAQSSMTANNDNGAGDQGSGSGGGGSASASTSHGHGAGGGGGGGGGINAGYGGPRETTVPAEKGRSMPKFAMIAIGIVCAAAACFAALKGKHAS